MARLRRSNGTFRATTLSDFGFAACDTCGGFYPMKEPELDDCGRMDPCAVGKSGPCPHCGHDPETPVTADE